MNIVIDNRRRGRGRERVSIRARSIDMFFVDTRRPFLQLALLVTSSCPDTLVQRIDTPARTSCLYSGAVKKQRKRLELEQLAIENTCVYERFSIRIDFRPINSITTSIQRIQDIPIPREINMAELDLTKVSTTELQHALEPISIPSDSPKATFANWAKTFTCRPQRVFAPTTTEQCRQILELGRREGARIHPVGVGHSPSDLACTNGWLVKMEGVSGLIRVSSGHPGRFKVAKDRGAVQGELHLRGGIWIK